MANEDSGNKLDKKFWNKYFELYDVLNNVYPYKDLLNQVINEMDLKEGKVVLDAGSGTGNLSVLISQKKAKVVGLDASEIGVEIYKRKIPTQEVLLHDLKGEIPFPDNHFDYICCINTLFAISPYNRKKICCEFYRILKPGGKIIMTNLIEGYRPINIYINHIKNEIKKLGFLKSLINFVRLIKPTILMFFYNKKMTRENKNGGEIKFFTLEEQNALLKEANFSKISESKPIFANQALLTTAFKL